jgi:dihydroorotate dehydrogenase
MRSLRETRTDRHGSGFAASLAAGPAPSQTVTAMGLLFANPLGLAAGYDRTGELVPSLRACGFGHVEVGTITPATGHAGTLRRSSSMRVGINIGSERPGLDDGVIEDFTTTLKRAFGHCDYVVANLSASGLQRDGNTPGVVTLVKRLGVARDVLSAVGGYRVPLLLKLDAGPQGTSFPAAIMAARVSGLDGIVLVSDCLNRIAAISAYLDRMAIVSVGGVRSADDVRARIAAGAKLVQVHSAYVNGGGARIRRILKALA